MTYCACEQFYGGDCEACRAKKAPTGYAGLGSHASDLRELRACQERIAELEDSVRLYATISDNAQDMATNAAGAVVNQAARIATLEAERADSIPRAVLVSALRERGESSCGEQDHRSGPCPGCWRGDELIDLADEIERGEWPVEGE